MRLRRSGEEGDREVDLTGRQLAQVVPALIFTPAGWEAFTLGVQDGELDLA